MCIRDRITTVKLPVDWSGMVYSPTGSLDLFLTLGCMISNFLYLSFSTLYITVLGGEQIPSFCKINPPVSIKPPPLNVFEINKPPGGAQRRIYGIYRNKIELHWKKLCHEFYQNSYTKNCLKIEWNLKIISQNITKRY